MAVRVKSVQKGSAAETLGLSAGSMLYSADGNEINDMLDYQFYTAGERFELAVMKDGQLDYLKVEKGEMCIRDSSMTAAASSGKACG